MVFILADVQERNPERCRGAKGPLPERPLLSLIYKASPHETRGRFCGGTSLPYKEKENMRFIASAEPVQDHKTRPSSSEEATFVIPAPLYLDHDMRI